MLTVTATWLCPWCESSPVLVDEQGLWECLVCSTTGRVDRDGKVWMDSPGWDNVTGGVR
jgi:ribosomal protein L37AE/L43A